MTGFTIEAEVPFRIKPDLVTALEKLANDSQYLNKRQKASFLKNLKILNQQHDGCFGLKNINDNEMKCFVEEWMV